MREDGCRDVDGILGELYRQAAIEMRGILQTFRQAAAQVQFHFRQNCPDDLYCQSLLRLDQFVSTVSHADAQHRRRTALRTRIADQALNIGLRQFGQGFLPLNLHTQFLSQSAGPASSSI